MCVCGRARARACVWYENQFSALSSEGLLRSIIQLGLQPTNNSCSASWRLVCGGGRAVHFLNDICAPTLVFGFINARFSVSTRCPRAFSVWLFVVKSGTCCAGIADITMKLLFCDLPPILLPAMKYWCQFNHAETFVRPLNWPSNAERLSFG